MRRWHRIVLVAGLVGLAPVLAGCESFDLDKLDVFNLNQKKKLPGERKDLFPEGVPGVTQGIPPEYMKGNQPPPETADAIAAAGEQCIGCRRAERQRHHRRAAKPDRRGRAAANSAAAEGRSQAEAKGQGQTQTQA